MKNAFTMIELIFVIVVIGILSAVAIPRLAVTRTDALIVKGKSQVAAIRSGIVMQKSKNLLEGTSVNGSFYPSTLDDINSSYNSSEQKLFYYNDGNTSNILETPIYSTTNDGGWLKTGPQVYKFTVDSSRVVPFNYNPATGIFDCDHSGANCKNLAE